MRGGRVLLLANALANFDEAVGHDGGHAEEIVGGAEAAGGEVALWMRGVSYRSVWVFTAQLWV